MNNFLVKDLMINRHSARRFDPTAQISDQELEQLIQAARMTPTSYGMHNFRIISLRRSKFRDQLNPLFYNQPSFFQSSIYLIFISDTGKKLKEKTIHLSANKIFGDTDDDTKMMRYVANFEGGYEKKFQNNDLLADEWSSKSAYVASGILTVAAEQLGIDTCIQEGFEHEKLHRFLKEHNLISDDEKIYLGMALGRMEKNIKKQTYKKIRMPLEEFHKKID